jgi:hypothetical protein
MKNYWSIFSEGREKCKEVNNDCNKSNNPYKIASDEWKTWNRGWNSF